MRLVLHAGTHKTGTTTLQRVLSDNRVGLREQGLFYPRTSPFPIMRGHHPFAHAIGSRDAGDRANAARFLAAARQEARPGETVLISAEAFYRQVAGGQGWSGLLAPDYWETREAYLADLSSALRDFDVTVLICFRDPAYFLAWLHRVFVREGVWAGDLERFKSDYAERFEYDRQTALIRRYFPSVETYRFEDALKDGIVAHFFGRIGFVSPRGSEKVWERPKKRTAPT